MGRITSWYNQNRKIIWIVILTVMVVIALIQSLNNYYKNNKTEKSSSTNSTTTYNTDSYSIITEQEIDESVANYSTNLIKNFFNYCNNGKIEEAYNLLSADCKEELYPTVDDFKNKYYNIVFAEKRSYESTLWITSTNRNTYRMEIMVDLLSSGKKENMPIEDYYTITVENGKYKLNINNYIGKENINISKNQNNINVNIISKKIYVDYEIYEIEVKNNTGNKLIFNTKEEFDSIYIEDENGVKYIAFLNEIPDSELEISNGITKFLNIKINRGYKPNIKIKKIIFDNIKIGQDDELAKVEIDV